MICFICIIIKNQMLNICIEKFTSYFTSKAVINIVYDKFFEVLYFLKIHLCHSLKKL